MSKRCDCCGHPFLGRSLPGEHGHGLGRVMLGDCLGCSDCQALYDAQRDREAAAKPTLADVTARDRAVAPVSESELRLLDGNR